MTPYFRAFLVFLAAGVLALLFGMKVLAAAEPAVYEKVPLYITSGPAVGLGLPAILADQAPISCYAELADLPKVRCLVSTGEVVDGRFLILKWVDATVVPLTKS